MNNGVSSAGSFRRFLRVRRIEVNLLLLSIAMVSAGCGLYSIPNQAAFLPLQDTPQSEAIVRVYGAPIPWTASIAVHCWFVVKRAGTVEFHRWEVWQTADGPYGHVRLDLGAADGDIGGGPEFILAELRGAAAEPVISFIESQSPIYECRNNYVVFPGPNSDSYVQWILDQTGWDVNLPWVAIGKDTAPVCE